MSDLTAEMQSTASANWAMMMILEKRLNSKNQVKGNLLTQNLNIRTQ